MLPSSYLRDQRIFKEKLLSGSYISASERGSLLGNLGNLSEICTLLLPY